MSPPTARRKSESVEWTNDLSIDEDSDMPPKPYDDLFIEPANDDDVVYGDYNDTMEDGTSSGKRPYVRLNAQLTNMTRHVGGDAKFKCEAAGSPLPLTFSWLKNHAPVEKDSRTRIRNRDYWSKLIISELDVLDSGYYQCVVSNAAGSVNTTSVLRVNNSPEGPSKGKSSHRGGKQRFKVEDREDDYLDDFSMDRGRLPSEEDEMFRVSEKAAGPGYVPLGGPHSAGDRWLDRHPLRIGDCVMYRGDACRDFLSGKYVMITSDNREEMYDIDRNLRAAMMFIKEMPNISEECKRFSHSVACYHKYKVCDKSPSSSQIVPGTSNGVISICRKDCDRLKDEVCPNEMKLASQHDLVGDDAKALLPKCDSLSLSASKCIPVLTPALPLPPISAPTDKDDAVHQPDHWCYVDNGSNYEGAVSVSKTGKQCMYWSKTPKASDFVRNVLKLRGSKNYCRNPGGVRSKPWCYTSPHSEAEECDVAKCPPSYYPHLRDTVSTESTDALPGRPRDSVVENPFLDKMTNFVTSMSSQWHIAAMCGVATLAIVLLLFFICCMCGCRKKRKAPSSVMSSVQKNGGPLQSCNGSSLANSAANSAYFRKLNGTATSANQSNAAFELSSLLPLSQNTNAQNMYGMPVIPYGETTHSRPSTEPPLEPYHIPQIAYESLDFGELIGKGHFGSIECASWHGGTYGGQAVQVAVKGLRENATQDEVKNFEEEVKTVAAFEHANVIRLLGVTYRDGHYLCAVYEYMVHGDLHEFLRLRAPQHDQKHDQERLCSDAEDFVRIAIQVASGMEYLSGMNFVHRDLATRNCLVGEKRVIKISDFGPMRGSYEKDYYRIDQRGFLPIRWMAPEAIDRNRFSQASDIWSFGVTLWEIYSYGKTPYGSNSNEYVLDMLNMRNLLEPPYGCPTNIYSLMIECWHEHPDRRPSFAELHARLSSWSLTSPAQSILSHQNRASSTHSGGSSGVRGSRQTSSSTQSGNGSRNVGINNFAVPSPAPGQGTATKLTLTNNGNSIVHSTPISQNIGNYANGNNSLTSRGLNSRSDASPLMRRQAPANNYDYSEEDESD